MESKAAGKVDTDFAKNSFEAGWRIASLTSSSVEITHGRSRLEKQCIIFG